MTSKVSFGNRLKEFGVKYEIKLRLDEDIVDYAVLEEISRLSPKFDDVHMDGCYFYEFYVSYEEAFGEVTEDVIARLKLGFPSKGKKRRIDDTLLQVEVDFSKLVARSLVESGAVGRYYMIDDEVAAMKREVDEVYKRLSTRAAAIEGAHGIDLGNVLDL